MLSGHLYRSDFYGNLPVYIMRLTQKHPHYASHILYLVDLLRRSRKTSEEIIKSLEHVDKTLNEKEVREAVERILKRGDEGGDLVLFFHRKFIDELEEKIFMDDPMKVARHKAYLLDEQRQKREQLSEDEMFCVKNIKPGEQIATFRPSF